MRNPRLITFTPCACRGTIFSFTTSGGALTPIIRGTLGPYTSASMSPTRAPVDASAMARFVATVDFPTPPFPLDTAMMRPRWGYDTGVGADGRGAAAGAAFMTGSVRAAGDGAGGGAAAALFATD